MAALFVYGTLLFEPVRLAIVGYDLPAVPGALTGYDRRYISGRVYPGIVEAPGREVTGLVLSPIASSALSALDVYEDDFYERRAVTVETQAGTVVAEAYVVPEASRHLLSDKNWTPTLFEQRHLAEFVASLQNQGESKVSHPRR